MSETNEQAEMHQRRVTLADGRYLIFYSFDEPSAPAIVDTAAEHLSRREPDAEPEAEGEPRV
jgi:hypothetical protein